MIEYSIISVEINEKQNDLSFMRYELACCEAEISTLKADIESGNIHFDIPLGADPTAVYADAVASMQNEICEHERQAEELKDAIAETEARIEELRVIEREYQEVQDAICAELMNSIEDFI